MFRVIRKFNPSSPQANLGMTNFKMLEASSFSLRLPEWSGLFVSGMTSLWPPSRKFAFVLSVGTTLFPIARPASLARPIDHTVCQ